MAEKKQPQNFDEAMLEFQMEAVAATKVAKTHTSKVHTLRLKR